MMISRVSAAASTLYVGFTEARARLPMFSYAAVLNSNRFSTNYKSAEVLC